MQGNVAVRMCSQALRMRYADTAKYKCTAILEGVNIEALTDPHKRPCSPRKNSASSRSSSWVILILSAWPSIISG